MSVKSVKSKIKNLRSYFSKEQHKVLVAKSGAGADEKYESSWFAYKPLLFIEEFVNPRSMKDSLTEESVISDDIEGGEEYVQYYLTDEDQGPVMDAPHSGAAEKSSCTQHKLLSSCTGTCRGIKRKIEDDDRKEDQAFDFLEAAAKLLTNKDDCSVFGDMIAAQLRKLNPRHQAIARNKIQNIIFDFEMQEMDFSQNNT